MLLRGASYRAFDLWPTTSCSERSWPHQAQWILRWAYFSMWLNGSRCELGKGPNNSSIPRPWKWKPVFDDQHDNLACNLRSLGLEIWWILQETCWRSHLKIHKIANAKSMIVNANDKYGERSIAAWGAAQRDREEEIEIRRHHAERYKRMKCSLERGTGFPAREGHWLPPRRACHRVAHTNWTLIACPTQLLLLLLFLYRGERPVACRCCCSCRRSH